MQTNQSLRPAPKKPSPKPNHANFLEALKSSSTNAVKKTTNFATDTIGSFANTATDSIFGGPSSNNPEPQNQPFDFGELLRANESKTKQQVKAQYEYGPETVIFSRRQQEVEQKIKSIQQELRALASEINTLDQSTQTAIVQEVTDPGTYHLNFFDKLLIFIRQLRKSVSQSRNWMNTQSKRSKTKSYFWSQANKKQGGTKYMLSSERTIQTQTG